MEEEVEGHDIQIDTLNRLSIHLLYNFTHLCTFCSAFELSPLQGTAENPTLKDYQGHFNSIGKQHNPKGFPGMGMDEGIRAVGFNFLK